MTIEFEQCYRAASAKDPRFDGWFFTAVTSTGIYCRPSCPAMTPKRENVRFYPTAAACQQAGFRACKRCRPDASPGSPEWNVRGDVVARAMRLIADGVVDREGVPALASRLGYSARQLQRLLGEELGAGPLAIARAQRAQTARTLIEASSLTMAEIALAVGLLEHPAVQRHGQVGVRAHPDRAAPPGQGCGRSVRRHAAPEARVPRSAQPREPVRSPRRDGVARRRGDPGRDLPADAAPPLRKRYRRAHARGVAHRLPAHARGRARPRHRDRALPLAARSRCGPGGDRRGAALRPRPRAVRRAMARAACAAHRRRRRAGDPRRARTADLDGRGAYDRCADRSELRRGRLGP